MLEVLLRRREVLSVTSQDSSGKSKENTSTPQTSGYTRQRYFDFWGEEEEFPTENEDIDEAFLIP